MRRDAEGRGRTRRDAEGRGGTRRDTDGCGGMRRDAKGRGGTYGGTYERTTKTPKHVEKTVSFTIFSGRVIAEGRGGSKSYLQLYMVIL